jgi:mediator of RNA polymerase II transcription subunit 10
MIPMQVLADIDNSRNPMQLTRERLERAATENQFMNGKITAIDVSVSQSIPRTLIEVEQSYRKLLSEALCQNFPELEQHFHEQEGKE